MHPTSPHSNTAKMHVAHHLCMTTDSVCRLSKQINAVAVVPSGDQSRRQPQIGFDVDQINRTTERREVICSGCKSCCRVMQMATRRWHASEVAYEKAPRNGFQDCADTTLRRLVSRAIVVSPNGRSIQPSVASVTDSLSPSDPDSSFGTEQPPCTCNSFT